MPLIVSLINLRSRTEEKVLLSEIRKPAKLPALKLVINHPRQFIKEVELYYNDNFGFRTDLIKCYGMAKVLWLGESASPKVTVGKNGWFFLRTDGSNNEIDYYRSIAPFKSKELADWKRTLEQRNDWLASQGIHYLMIIAPNKTTIYPEFLPESLNRVRQESRLDQLIAYLRVNSDVKILDLRDPLRSAKVNNLIYARRDTHWNDLGAFVAYQQIIKSLATWYPNLKALPMSDFKLKVTYGNADLINLLGLTGILKDEKIELIARTPRLARRVNPGIYKPDLQKNQQLFATELKDSSLPRAVMFHDSFTEQLSPFISEHFKRILYLRQDDFELQVIQQEHPDIVIQEMVERKLMSPIIREKVAPEDTHSVGRTSRS